MRNTNRKNKSGKFLLGTIIGGLIGSLTGLLLAPHSGEETQQLITEKRAELTQEARKRIEEGREYTIDRYEDVRNTVADWLETGSELLTEKSQEIKIEKPKKKEKAAA